MNDFKKEVIEFIDSIEPNLKKEIEKDIIKSFGAIYEYGLFTYTGWCSVLLIICRDYNLKLPDHIHNRIVLESQNEWTKEYSILYKERL
jgi:hypothetical protein